MQSKILSFINYNAILACLFVCIKISIGFSQDVPRVYVANQTSELFIIDGIPDESSWQKAIWSNSFIDIQGVKKPKFNTRMKMTWDDENLYVFAELSEPHVWAYLKQRDTIIFYNNDFEIFIDPDGDTHNYYELEVNALNTVWDLFLSKPYRNQGKILGDWDFKGLRSAVSVDGTINDPLDVDKSWSIEIAIPWSFATEPGRTTRIPKNEYWRMNFSRVNWDFDLVKDKYYRKKDSVTQKFLPENNWVWSPQEVINMHEPERWGYVYFSTEDVGNTTAFEIPKDEYVKWYLYELFRDYSKNKEEDKIGHKKEILGQMITPTLFKHEFGWFIWTVSPFTNNKISIKDDGKITINETK